MINHGHTESGDTGLRVAIAIALLARLGLFVFAMYFPIPNEQGEPVSPLLPPAYFDYNFYLRSLTRYTSDPAGIVNDFLWFYGSASSRFAHIISGPAFPIVIGVTGFARGVLLPLALIYLAASGLLAAAWIYWLRRQGMHAGWLLVFAVLPQPIWFMLIVSPDLLFAAEFASFFLAYFAAKQTRATRAIWTLSLTLMVLTRPNSFSILLFVAAETAWAIIRRRPVTVARVIGTSFLLIASALYLYPYFLTEMARAGRVLTYFGHTPAEYLAGIYGLPAWLDVPLSALSLVVAKALYFTGLRASYGATSDLLVLARAAGGLVLFPGLLALFVLAPARIKVLIALYCLPFLLGPAQDRYYLAVYPILFFYGATAISVAARSLFTNADNSRRAAAP